MSKKPDGWGTAKWDDRTVRYEPTPGVYGLYQNGVLKYIGQSSDTADRIFRDALY